LGPDAPLLDKPGYHGAIGSWLKRHGSRCATRNGPPRHEAGREDHPTVVKRYRMDRLAADGGSEYGYHTFDG
jgi:hypothetical protein